MLVWLNGTFGVGKTTTARLMVEQNNRWRAFDPECVGIMLRSMLRGQSLGGDFQHLPAWRRLVPIVATEIAGHTGQRLIAVQSVLRHTYWIELAEGVRSHGFKLFHVVLDADVAVLRQRIETADDQLALEWRLRHIDMYVEARDWMIASADVVIDTTAIPPKEVATQVMAAAPVHDLPSAERPCRPPLAH